MSARDDYPNVGVYREQWNTMCDEIDRQRAKVALLTPVVEAAEAWRATWLVATGPDDWDLESVALIAAVTAYRDGLVTVLRNGVPPLNTTVPGHTGTETP